MSTTGDVWRFIKKFMSQSVGRAPTTREIQDELDLASTSVVDYHIRKLEREGYLEKVGEPYGTRQIRLVGGKWTYEGEEYKDD